MWECLLQESHEVIFGAPLQVKKIRSHERRVVIGDGFNRGLEPRRLCGEPRHHWRHEDTGVDARLSQLTHRPETLERRSCTRFERSPRVLVNGWNAHVDGTTRAAPQVRENPGITDDHWTL